MAELYYSYALWVAMGLIFGGLTWACWPKSTAGFYPIAICATVVFPVITSLAFTTPFWAILAATILMWVPGMLVGLITANKPYYGEFIVGYVGGSLPIIGWMIFLVLSRGSKSNYERTSRPEN